MSNHILVPDNELPPNVPILGVDDVGAGWRRVSIGEVVRSSYQVYLLRPPIRWQLSSFYTREGFVNQGKATYRAPCSPKAWAIVAFPLVAKLVKGYWKLVWHGRFV